MANLVIELRDNGGQPVIDAEITCSTIRTNQWGQGSLELNATLPDGRKVSVPVPGAPVRVDLPAPAKVKPLAIPGVVVGWRSPDQTAIVKAALLRRCTETMWGRAFQSFDTATRWEDLYASFDAQASAGIVFFITCHPTQGKVDDWRHNPVAIARIIHQSLPANAAIHLVNETNRTDLQKWPGTGDDLAKHNDALDVSIPVARELRKLGRQLIFAPSLTTPTKALAEACIQALRAKDTERVFNGLAVDLYNDTSGLAPYLAARESSGGFYKVAVPEWGGIGAANLTPQKFSAMASAIVPNADYSFLWLGWASSERDKKTGTIVWHQAFELIGRDDKDTALMPVWKAKLAQTAVAVPA